MICLSPLASLTLMTLHWKGIFLYFSTMTYHKGPLLKGDMFLPFALTLKLQQIFLNCWKEKVKWRKNVEVWWAGDWKYIQYRHWVFERIFNVSEFTLPLHRTGFCTLWGPPPLKTVQKICCPRMPDFLYSFEGWGGPEDPPPLKTVQKNGHPGTADFLNSFRGGASKVYKTPNKVGP